MSSLDKIELVGNGLVAEAYSAQLLDTVDFDKVSMTSIIMNHKMASSDIVVIWRHLDAAARADLVILAARFSNYAYLAPILNEIPLDVLLRALLDRLEYFAYSSGIEWLARLLDQFGAAGEQLSCCGAILREKLYVTPGDSSRWRPGSGFWYLHAVAELEKLVADADVPARRPFVLCAFIASMYAIMPGYGLPAFACAYDHAVGYSRRASADVAALQRLLFWRAMRAPSCPVLELLCKIAPAPSVNSADLRELLDSWPSQFVVNMCTGDGPWAAAAAEIAAGPGFWRCHTFRDLVKTPKLFRAYAALFPNLLKYELRSSECRLVPEVITKGAGSVAEILWKFSKFREDVSCMLKNSEIRKNVAWTPKFAEFCKKYQLCSVPDEADTGALADPRTGTLADPRTSTLADPSTGTPADPSTGTPASNEYYACMSEKRLPYALSALVFSKKYARVREIADYVGLSTKPELLEEFRARLNSYEW